MRALQKLKKLSYLENVQINISGKLRSFLFLIENYFEEKASSFLCSYNFPLLLLSISTLVHKMKEFN